MHGIELKADTGDMNRKEPLPFVTLLLLEAGVFGILLFLRELDGVEYQTSLVLTVAAAVCGMAWYTYARHRILFLSFLSASVAACVLTSLISGDVLLEQAFHITRSLEGEQGLPAMQITELALLLAVVLSLLLFVLECLIPGHIVFYVRTILMLLAAPFLNVHIHVETVFLLFLSQIALGAMQIAVRWRKKRQLDGALRVQLSGKSGVAVSLAVTVIFSVSLILVMLGSESMFDAVSAADGYVQRSISGVTGGAGMAAARGEISRGNSYPTGATQLEVSVSRQPAQSMYLRGFDGGEYVGGAWILSDDEALFDDIAEGLRMPQGWGSKMYELYEDMYFVLNLYTLSEGPWEPVTLRIQPVNGADSKVYVPYYNKHPSSLGDGGYTCQYYEERDMCINGGSILLRFGTEGEVYMALQDLYMEQAQAAYTRVPTALLPRLTALVEENPMADLDEITEFIFHTLQDGVEYTRTPGWAPFNEDVVEYFLFERKAGYCEHFAVTAALMYRLYGVPARYVTGYLLTPSDFKLQEDGTYLAAATDEAAHAWVEIFLEDYGWTPVDVTPADDGLPAEPYPGFGSEQPDRVREERDHDAESPVLAQGSGKTMSVEKRQAKSDFWLEEVFGGKEFRAPLLIFFFCLVYSILLVPQLKRYRELWIARKGDFMSCRAVFERFMEMMHFGGLVPDCDGAEAEFADRLAKAGAGISRDEASRLVAVVNQAAFGTVYPDETEEAFVRQLYRRTAALVYRGLSWRKRLIFKYVKVF